MGPPQASQLVENRLRQRHEPLLVALADDAQNLVGPVDGANFQRGGFAMRRPQAYMTARQVLWVGLRIPLSRRRT
jgi:hypothetical protein